MDLVINDSHQILSDTQINLVEDSIQQIGDILNLPNDTEVSVSIVNNDEIQSFNNQYRGIDKPTDVISFASEESDLIISEEVPRNIGDIIISYQKIEEQAANLEHSFDRELVFLIIHSMLHLNGYDHVDVSEEEAEEMFSRQKEILVELGYDV